MVLSMVNGGAMYILSTGIHFSMFKGRSVLHGMASMEKA